MVLVILLFQGCAMSHVVEEVVKMNVSSVFESPLPAFFFLEGTSEGSLPRSWGVSPYMGPWDSVIDDSCGDDVFSSPQQTLRDHILPHTLQYWDASETPTSVSAIKVISSDLVSL